MTKIKSPIKKRKFQLTAKGIPLKAFDEMTIGEIKKLNKDYRRLLK